MTGLDRDESEGCVNRRLKGIVAYALQEVAKLQLPTKNIYKYQAHRENPVSESQDALIIEFGGNDA